ncbi:MAG: hypothetical protein OHK0024_37060 [Thalassobaculales bacterium]
MRAALAALALAALAAGAAPAQEESPDSLPPGPGREETFYGCAACHSMQLVTRQGMSRERWAETLKWMTERHGMPELPADDEKLILDYLAAQFGPGSTGGRASPFMVQPARRNPFAPQ